jgi:hypothetical protein
MQWVSDTCLAKDDAGMAHTHFNLILSPCHSIVRTLCKLHMKCAHADAKAEVTVISLDAL